VYNHSASADFPLASPVISYISACSLFLQLILRPLHENTLFHVHIQIEVDITAYFLPSSQSTNVSASDIINMTDYCTANTKYHTTQKFFNGESRFALRINLKWVQLKIETFPDKCLFVFFTFYCRTTCPKLYYIQY
jgi:hypothetical protein